MTTPALRPVLSRLLVLFAVIAFAATGHAAPPLDHWVGTWATAPVSANNGRPPAPAVVTLGASAIAGPSGAPPAAPQPPVSSPATPDANATRPQRPPAIVYGTADATLREIVHISIGGPAVRVVFTNEFGTEPLTIGAAHIAVSQGGSSFFLPAQTIAHLSVHGGADQTSYTVPGNVVGAKTLEEPTEIRSWPFVKGVDVKVPAHSAAVVAFGDSITDGAFAAQNQNARWPDELARRLLADKRTADVGVLNEGIGGNRILHDNTGPSALARFDRDVIAQAGVKWVIVLEAINDIGHAYDTHRTYDVVSADDLIAGYVQLAERAHMHGIKVYFATLTPYVGAGYESPAGEEVRKALNQWIRTTPEIDGFIDFEKATQDPASPDRFLPAYDHGDHLHPSDPGYKAMGDAIDLNLFVEKK